MMETNSAKYCIFFLCIVLAVSTETTNDTSSANCSQKETLKVYMDFAAEAIGKAKNSSSTLHETAEKCGQKEALMSYLEVADEMIIKAKNKFLTCDNCNSSRNLDCSDLLSMGYKSSGVYTILPKKRLTEKESFDVYCDMETDGGGWTVIQRRGDFDNPLDYFYRDWESYKVGFGELEEEFWLGNDYIFALTNQRIYSVRFDLTDDQNTTKYAHYDTFWIDGENSKYTLHISDYSGTAGESMFLRSNNQKFSTKDQDNDTDDKRHCAETFKSAWWFANCFKAHLNGETLKGKQTNNYGKIWISWKESDSLARTEIKIRPKNFKV